mgnify:CR=1 FL=1
MQNDGTNHDLENEDEAPYISREQRAAVANRYLTRLRNIHGATSTIGRLCSKIMEQLDNLPPGPEDRIEYLTPDWIKDQRASLLKGIEFSERDLQRALHAVQ